MYVLLPLLLLCFLSGCNNQKEPHLPIEAPEGSLHSLDASTQIIMQLIEKKALSTVLESSDQEGIDRLIKNFSPAEMALEAEALNWQKPVILFFIAKEDPAYQKMHSIVENAAKKYESSIKCIEVDSSELFKITEQFHFDTVPALLLMHNRKEIARAEDLTNENFEGELQKLIDTPILLS